MRVTSKTTPRVQVGIKCPRCDRANLSRKRAQVSGERNGESISVEMEALVCPKCGYATVPNERMGEYVLRVSDAYRKRHRLLTGVEIRARRERLGMSQVQFAKHLGVGVASVKRWELGQIQDEAMNALVRLRTDPSAARRNYDEVVALLG